MERGEADPGDDERQADLHQEAPHRSQPADLLGGHRQELQRQYREIEHHAPADLEQRRVGVPVDEHVPDVPRQAEIEHEAHRHGQVAEKRRQDRRADDRVEALELEDVDGGGDDEAAGGQRHPAHDVESNPDAPGVAVGKIGRRAQAEQEAVDADGRRQPGEGPEEELQAPDPSHGRAPPSPPLPVRGVPGASAAAR